MVARIPQNATLTFLGLQALCGSIFLYYFIKRVTGSRTKTFKDTYVPAGFNIRNIFRADLDKVFDQQKEARILIERTESQSVTHSKVGIQSILNKG